MRIAPHHPLMEQPDARHLADPGFWFRSGAKVTKEVTEQKPGAMPKG